MTQIARSVFFYHLKPKVDKDVDVRLQIQRIKDKNPHYGYRRVNALLKGTNHKRIQRLMQEMGLQVKPKKTRKYNAYRGELGRLAPNLLERNFRAEKPNQKWLTDVTEMKAKDGQKCYLFPILDCFNNEIIAYELSRSANWQQARSLLEKAIAKLPTGTNPILHSDQGWQYQMRQWRTILQQNGVRQSMSRKGNCLDNAAMESFFGRLKTECVYAQQFETVDELEQAIREYIRYYNEKRIQLKLKGLSPIQYRIQSLI